MVDCQCRVVTLDLNYRGKSNGIMSCYYIVESVHYLIGKTPVLITYLLNKLCANELTKEKNSITFIENLPKKHVKLDII